MCSVPGVPTPGSEVSVVVSRVGVDQSWGLVELWVNMNNDLRPAYAQLQEELQRPQRHFGRSQGRAGDLCLVSVDQTWHRAKIVSVQQEKYEVFLMDLGQPRSTTAEAMAWGADECFVLPPEMEACVLANVLSTQNPWTERAANFLASLPGKEFRGLVQQALMPRRTILLDVPTISKHLCKEGVVKKVPGAEFRNVALKWLNLPEDGGMEPIPEDDGMEPMEHSPLENDDHYFYPELHSNALESVRVTQVITPGSIFCQLLIFSNAIKTLTEQLNEEGNDQSGSKEAPPQSSGTPCAAKGLDGKWGRALLKQSIMPHNSKVFVFFVDEGRHDFVPVTDVKRLERRFLRTPVVTYHCSLEGVRCDKEYSRDESKRLKSLLLNQNIVARFERHILPDDFYWVSFYTPEAVCINEYFFEEKEVEMNEAKLIFSHEVIFNGAANAGRVPKSSEKDSFTQNYSSPFSPMEMPLCESLTVGANVGVKISHIDSVSKFWCQTSQCDKKLDVLMKDLQDHYASVHPKPLVDAVCVARNPDNNMWYRAKIIPNQPSPDVEVRFIDYGQTKKVPLCELRPIDPTFLRLDAQAFQCSLFNAPPVDANYADEEFHKFVDSRSAQNDGLKCVIKATAPDEDGTWLNLVDLQTQSESATQVLAEKLAARPEAYDFSGHDIEVNSMEKISISFSETVHSFYCQLDRNLPLFQRVQSDVEKLVPNAAPSDGVLPPNAPCFARYADSNWCRGKVVETFPSLKVYLVDFGKTLALNKADVRPFPPEVSAARTIPVLAIPLGLFNVPEEIPPEVNEWFAEKVVGSNFTMSVIEKGPNGKLMVELLDGSRSLNAQVREKIVNIQVENKHLCNGSKIIPVSKMEVDEGQAQQNGSQMLPKFQNGGRDMEDWILVDFEQENNPAVKESQEQIEQTNAMEVDDENKMLPATTSSEKVLGNFMYKKPILSLNKTQELYASCISKPDLFWCQCSNTGDLDKVIKLAQIEGKAAQDPFFPLRLLSGHPCLALYKSDRQWYRAQVIQKNLNTFSVVFIDYGNEEDIDYKDVRPVSASLLEVAPQAFLCSLDEADETEDKWTDKFLDKFYYALVDKLLKVKVLGMEQNSEIKMPQYVVQIDDVGLHKLLQKYGISINGDALNESPKTEIKPFFHEPNVLVNKTLKGRVSYISTPGYFWCQCVDAEDLNRIDKRAQKQGRAEDPLDPETLAPGSPCLALDPSDDKWYRAQVITREKDKVSVVFIDYGDDEEISIFNVRPITPRLMEVQPQAFLCYLENFDEDAATWDDVHCKNFTRLLLDKIITLKILAVELNEEVRVPQYTVQFEFDIARFCSKDPNQHLFQNKSQNASVKAPTPDLTSCKYSQPQLPVNESVMAYASSISGPEYFWCQYQDSSKLDEISKLAQIEGRAQHDPNFANNLSPGNPCLALFSDDNMWNRAQILSKSQDKFSVLFIDHGNEADVIIRNVRPMSSRLFESQPQAFLCSLEGFDLTKGAWEDEVYDHFFDLLVDNLLKVTPSCSVANQEVKVPQFFVQIECGSLAVNEVMLKFWKSNDQIEDISSKLSANVSISSRGLTFRKPEVSVSQTQQVYASCIVDPHFFWCQFADSAALDNILKRAQEVGPCQPRPRTLDKGDVCLALFEGQWCRALVRSSVHHALTVVFVDYGNEAELSIEDTREIPPPLLEPPPQAFLCSLQGFEPTSGSWDDRGCDSFFERLVDRPLRVGVATAGEHGELGVPQYSVQVECGGVCVNHDMAAFWSAEAPEAPQ